MSNNNNHIGRKIAIVAIGSALVIGGAALYLYHDDNARSRIEGVINRERAKYYVRHNLNGSDALVKAVDKLSDAEVNTLVKLANSASNVKDDAQNALSNLVDSAKDKASQVTDKVADYF